MEQINNSNQNSNKRPDETVNNGANSGRGAKLRQHHSYGQLIGAIDQGTSSTRFLVFENQTGHLVASSQVEIKRITPKEGWVEIDPTSIISSVYATIENVHEQLEAKLAARNKQTTTTSGLIDKHQQQHQHQMNNNSSQQDTNNNGDNALRQPSVDLLPMLKCIGICNQRESTVVWDSQTGQPLYNVIVWMDNRTKDLVDAMIDSVPGRDLNRLKDKTGLPLSTYFSAFKLKWLIDNVAEVRLALHEKRLMFGTVDTWILWNLTGKHLTDVTNASRTFLMDIETLQWDKSLCKQLGIPMEILPKILSSADQFGQLQFGPFRGTPITGVIGDQSAALFGHNCLQLGQTKATFGTGCFILQNIGSGPLSGALRGVHRDAKRGLITTVGYKLGDRPATYALEGSVKIAGAALTWLRDNLQLIQNYEECDQLVNRTTNSAGVFFVPALGGLYSPYWDPNAAGLYIGLSQFTKREHLVRATFDSIAFQTNDILSLMRGVANGLMIDGGLCKSDNLCQILADITGYDIVRPSMCETSALGAAMVAGYGAGIWSLESMMSRSTNQPDDYANVSNQNHHYPHESLNYEDKFSSLIQSKSFKSQSKSKFSQKNTNTNNIAATYSQPIEQPARQRRLRHSRPTGAATSGISNRTHCQLDAGGGVNDDAGGGGPKSIATTTTSTAPSSLKLLLRQNNKNNFNSLETQSDYCEEDLEEEEEASQLMSSSDTDLEGANCILGELHSSGTNNNDNKPQHQQHQEELPIVIADSIESSYESTDTSQQGPLLGINRRGGANQQYGAPSSGYSSGDNFEIATSISTETTNEAMGQMSTLRVGSSILSSLSQATLTSDTAPTTNGRESAATLDLNNGQDHEVGPLLTQPQAPASHQIPFHLINGCSGGDGAGQHEDLVADAELASGQDDYSSGGEVHAFGGRDSYGEDEYDSSTASNFYTEDDNDEDFDEVDELVDEEAATATVMEPLVDAGEQLKQTGPSRRPLHRAHQGSIDHHAKTVDVFSPYISLEHRTDLVGTWRSAVERSMQWTKVHHEEVRRIDYQRLSSLPISMYLFFSVGMVALSSMLSPLVSHG